MSPPITKQTAPVYVDFNRFCRGEKNRDLLASQEWQNNVRLLTASLPQDPSSAGRAGKPGSRR